MLQENPTKQPLEANSYVTMKENISDINLDSVNPSIDLVVDNGADKKEGNDDFSYFKKNKRGRTTII